jgi:hypothetical protein
MVCLPTITTLTGSWARCSETSRADVRQTHRATVRSDERGKSSYAREGHHVLSQLFDWQRFIYHIFYCSNGSW